MHVGVVPTRAETARQRCVERELDAAELPVADILRLRRRVRQDDRLNQVTHVVVEHRGRRAGAAEQPGPPHLDVRRPLRPEIRIRRGEAEPRAVQLEDDREARPIGNARVPLPRPPRPPDERALQVHGVRTALGVLEDPARGAEVLCLRDLIRFVADTADHVDGGRDADGVFERHRPRVLRLLLFRLLGAERRVRRPAGLLFRVDVGPVVKRALRGVGRARRRAELDRRAVGVVVVGAVEAPGERLRGVADVVERIETVREGVVVRLRVDVGRRAELRVRQHRRVLHVPPRPAPVAVGGHRRIVVDVERRTLLAGLLGVVEGVFVGRVRRHAELQVGPPVLGVGAQTLAAALQ